MSGIGHFVIGLSGIGGDGAGATAPIPTPQPPLFGDHRAAIQTLILPYLRTSPIHIPRRDLVLSSADSLTLRVTIVESDDPSAQALFLTGGIGGPSARLLIWADGGERFRWDYGAPSLCRNNLLWASAGVIADAIGSFDIVIPAGAMACWPRRCGWAVQLDFDSDTQSQMLAGGSLHVVWSVSAAIDHTLILTDDGIPITTDDLSALLEA